MMEHKPLKQSLDNLTQTVKKTKNSMVLAESNSKILVCTKDKFKTVSIVDLEGIYIRLKIIILVNSRMDHIMVMGNIIILIRLLMKAFGKIMFLLEPKMILVVIKMIDYI